MIYRDKEDDDAVLPEHAVHEMLEGVDDGDEADPMVDPPVEPDDAEEKWE